MSVRGSCLCGALAYEASGPVSPIAFCHCQTCRKTHGSAFSSVATAPKLGFRWLKGEDHRRQFESSPGKLRHFCGNCGSHIVAERVDTDVMLLRMGCVDGDPEVRPAVHIWRSDAAEWFDPKIDLPELPEGIKTPNE